LLDYLTSVQISEWEAYDQIDPIGKWRDDYYVASTQSLIVNTARSIHGKRGVKMTTFEEFMPNWSGEARPVKKQNPEEMKEALLSFARRHNKQLEKKNKLRTTPPEKKMLK